MVGPRRGVDFENADGRPRGDTTVGVDVETWSPTEGLHFSMWDFAGQEDYYQTHSLFITSQALFVLVVDVHRYDPDTNHDAVAQRWLDAIEARATQPVEVVLVLTHADMLDDEAEVERRAEALRGKVRNVRAERRAQLERRKKRLARTAGAGNVAALHLQIELEDLDEDLRSLEAAASNAGGAPKVVISSTFAVSCNPEKPSGFVALRGELVRLGMKQGRFLPKTWAQLLESAATVRERARRDQP